MRVDKFGKRGMTEQKGLSLLSPSEEGELTVTRWERERLEKREIQFTETNRDVNRVLFQFMVSLMFARFLLLSE
jgi:hypothetical protein